MIYRYELEGKCGKDDMGQWVKYEDHLAVVEQLEYELRYLREQYAESIEAREMCRIDLLPPFGPGC